MALALPRGSEKSPDPLKSLRLSRQQCLTPAAPFFDRAEKQKFRHSNLSVRLHRTARFVSLTGNASCRLPARGRHQARIAEVIFVLALGASERSGLND